MTRYPNMLDTSAKAEKLPGYLRLQANHVDQATAFIDKSALISNVLHCKKMAGLADIFCMVKANAYGHGMIDVANLLNDYANGFGVSRLEEGIELREAGCQKPIIIFSEQLSPATLKKMQQHNLTPTIFSNNRLMKNIDFCESNQLSYWVKIDSGMHRLGISCSTALEKCLLKAKFCETIITHFHSANEKNLIESEKQLQYFSSCLEKLNIIEKPHSIQAFSIANSSALLNHLEIAGYQQWKQQHLNLSSNLNEKVRPGIMLYGIDPLDKSNSNSETLQPVMTLTAPVVDVRQVPSGESVGYNQRWIATKDSTIATVAIGYGDGYPRHAKNGTPLLINGHKAYLVGSVSMDTIGVDISECLASGAYVKPGDTAILWGQELSINTIAAYADTISYELSTQISPRVHRVYF